MSNPVSQTVNDKETDGRADILSEASRLARAYLDAMEGRQLDAARNMLAEVFTMQFPGTPPMTRLEQLFERSGTKYKFVTKSYKRVDALHGDGDTVIVYCMGTLAGEWSDGTAFEGIRFIDRFEIKDRKIVRQDVWNDMGEFKKS